MNEISEVPVADGGHHRVGLIVVVDLVRIVPDDLVE